MRNANVFNVWRNGKCQVAWQRPWCCRPGQKRVAIFQFETNRKRWVLHLLVGVIHASFGIRQRGFKRPRVWKHTETFVNEALVPQRFECPHHTFHVRHIEGLVIVGKVDPASLARYITFPIARVLQHRDLAIIIELFNSKISYCLSARNAQLSFGFGFSGQPVAIPTETTLDSLSAHGLISRHCIFYETRKQVAVVR